MTTTESSTRIIYGDLNFTIPSHMNYGKLVIDLFIKKRDNIALIDGSSDDKLSFGELVQLIVNTSSSLMRLGVKRDEVVAVCSENRMEYLITAIAAWCSGATVTFLNSAYNKNELVHTMHISKPKYMFLSPATYKNFYEAMVSTNIVKKFFMYGNDINDPKLTKFNDLVKTHVPIDKFEANIDSVNGLAQTALILYSSGTTGLPKGAKLTHLNLITAQKHKRHIKKDLVCLTIAPWANTIGIMCTMDELTHNKTVIFMNGFKEDKYLACIQKYKVGYLIVVPPMLVIFSKSSVLKNYDVSSVEYMQCGGSSLDFAVIEEIKKRFSGSKNVLQGYGMTECTGKLTVETDTDFRPGSVGRIIGPNNVKIADVETGKALGPYQEGEVRIKGPGVFGGYIGHDMKDHTDEEGYFKTGDICYYDKDGYFHFVDRIKELIKYKSGQVAPSELEGILLQHPNVKDAAVVGKPDPLAGELPTAFVVPKPGSKVTDRELIDYVATKVSSWKQLRGGVYFIEEIPKTSSGKILRRVLRDYLKKPASKL